MSRHDSVIRLSSFAVSDVWRRLITKRRLTLRNITMKLSKTYEMVDAVVRFGSFRRAADKMFITSTALNRRIIGLEQELGVDLFDRHPHGVRLTVAGELLITHIRKYFADLESVKSAISDLSGERRGEIRVATTNGFADLLTIESVKYRNIHPAVSIKVEFMTLDMVEANLIDHSADFGLILGSLDPRVFYSQFSRELPIKAVMNKSHPLAKHEKVSFGDCSQFPMALLSSNMGIREAIDRCSRSKDIKINPVIETNNIGFLINYTLLGDTISFIVEGTSLGQTDNPNLITRDLSGKDNPHITMQLAQLRGKILSVASGKFASQVSNRLSEIEKN